MNSAAFTYIDTAVGGATYRNNIQRLDTFHPNGTPDVYMTYRRFPEDLRTYTSKNRNPNTGRPSVSGYNGPCQAPFFPIDIDVDGDLDTALQETRRVARILHERWEIPLEALQLYYSGNKGFHIEIPETLFGGFGVLPAQISAARFKSLSTLLVTVADSLPVDPAIYDAMRLWRVPNTRNAKTGRYKVPLTAAEVFNLTAEQIAELGRARRDVDTPDADEWGAIPALVEAWQATAQQQPRQRSAPSAIDNEPITHGRNNYLTSTGGRIRAATGLSEASIYAALWEHNLERCQPPLEEAEVRQIAASLMRYPAGTLPPPPPEEPDVAELRERVRIAEAEAMQVAIVRATNLELAESQRRASDALEAVRAELSNPNKDPRDKLAGLATVFVMHDLKKSRKHTDAEGRVNVRRGDVAMKMGMSDDSVTKSWTLFKEAGHTWGRVDVTRTVPDDSRRGSHGETDVWMMPGETLADDLRDLLRIELPRKQGGKRTEKPKVQCAVCGGYHLTRAAETICEDCGDKTDHERYDINERIEAQNEAARRTEDAARARLQSLPINYRLGKTLLASREEVDAQRASDSETLLASPINNKDSETLVAFHKEPTAQTKPWTNPPPVEGMEEFDPWAQRRLN